jgi:hypothetical protein
MFVLLNLRRLRFVIDREIVTEQVEAILTQLLSIAEERKIVYKSSKGQRDNLHRILKLLEDNYNTIYENMHLMSRIKR